MKKEFKRMILWILCSFLTVGFLVCCGGGGGGGGGGGVPQVVYTAQDWRNLYEHNAIASEGFTSRWPGRVTICNVLPEYSRRWEGCTSGRIMFDFVNYNPDNGISGYLATALKSVGLTHVFFNRGTKHFVKAEIFIHPDYWNPHQGPHVWTHEMGHALGFYGHTDDGCIMDPTIQSRNYISDLVGRIMTHLYSYPPNTNVTSRMFEAAREYPAIRQEDGSLLIVTPKGEYYVKEVDEETMMFSSGPFYDGPIQDLPAL